MTVGVQPRSEMLDEDLIVSFQQTGHSEYFAELFARYRRQVYFACKGFFSDGNIAEDATQETFLRAYQNMHRFSGGNFGGWLMRIAKNICIDLWRKSQPETELREKERELEQLPSGEVLEQTSDLHLAVQQVLQELQTLPPEQRRCVELKIEGYSYEETAASTGLTVQAVKSHLQNGRRTLWLRVKGTLAELL
jgi:RNA polymerase sigma factor (sigma-70 family)